VGEATGVTRVAENMSLQCANDPSYRFANGVPSPGADRTVFTCDSWRGYTCKNGTLPQLSACAYCYRSCALNGRWLGCGYDGGHSDAARLVPNGVR